jgi:hypothetical protein
MTAITRQTAEAKRDTGMALAEDKANRDAPFWSDRALLAVEKYCLAHPGQKFLGEDVREWAEAKRMVSVPENEKAWGSVFRRAANLKIIRKIGYAPARSSNLSPKCLWRAA